MRFEGSFKPRIIAMNNAVTKQEVTQQIPTIAPVVAMPSQATKKVKIPAGPVNYSREQLLAYCDSQLTGKAVVGKPFNQTISETNFTEEDRKLIQEARRNHRLTLSVGPAKAAIIDAIRAPALKMVAVKENAKGDKRALRFHNPTIVNG